MPSSEPIRYLLEKMSEIEYAKRQLKKEYRWKTVHDDVEQVAQRVRQETSSKFETHSHFQLWFSPTKELRVYTMYVFLSNVYLPPLSGFTGVNPLEEVTKEVMILLREHCKRTGLPMPDEPKLNDEMLSGYNCCSFYVQGCLRRD